MTYVESYAIMCQIMDKRDKYFRCLKEFYVKHGVVPDNHKKAFSIGKAEKFKPWRKQRGVLKAVERAVKKASKMKGLEYLTSEDRIKLLEGLIR